MIKKLILATALTLAATTSMAADVVYEEPSAPVVYTPSFTWTGFNVGVQGGYGWNDLDLSEGADSASIGADGGILGGFIGYNHQFDNNWVLGIEGDFEGNWAEETLDFAGIPLEYGLDWQASVRARVGYAFDRTLLYGTAGWAVGKGYIQEPGDPKFTDTFNGYTVGVGVDHAFTDMVFGRIEYRYTDFGSKNYDLPVKAELDQHAIRVGLGVKF